MTYVIALLRRPAPLALPWVVILDLVSGARLVDRQVARPRYHLQRFAPSCIVCNVRGACSSAELFARVSRFKLVPNGQDQDDVFGGEPTALRDISVTTARKDQFAPTLLGGSPEQRMIR